MILELAILKVKNGKEKDFENDFKKASIYISSIEGYLGHSLKKCIEVPNKYILLVRWKTIEDHEIGFRKSEVYNKWKQILHHYYNPFPTVEHYETIFKNNY